MRTAVLNMIGDMPFVTPGMHRLGPDGWTRLELAVIANDEGDRSFAQGLIADLERRLKVTDGDRLAALYGRDVVAGPHTPLERMKPRKERRKAFFAEINAKPPKPIEEREKAVKKTTQIKDGDGPTGERKRKGEFELEPVDFLDPTARLGHTGETKKGFVEVSTRTRNSFARTASRLERFQGLTKTEVDAGLWLAKLWDETGYDTRVTANLLATGGGITEGPEERIDARTELHYAIQVLNLLGADQASVVIAVVIEGQNSALAGSKKYADEAKAKTYVAAVLQMGLRLLAAHLNVMEKNRSASPREAARARYLARHIRAARAKNAAVSPAQIQA